MPAPQILTDHELRCEIAAGATQSDIAARFGISRSAVSQRVSKLNENGIVRRNFNPNITIMSVWDARTAAQENYRRVLAMLDDNTLSNLDKIRVARELRQQLTFSFQIVSPISNEYEREAFIGEALETIGEEFPEVRDKIIDRLEELRAAAKTSICTRPMNAIQATPVDTPPSHPL